MVEIANRIGFLETNIVTERTARSDAEAVRANFDSPTTQTQAVSTGLIDTKVWGKPDSVDACAKGAWNE